MLARIDQLQLRGKILGDQLLVHALRLARQPDLLLEVLHLGLVAGEIGLVLLGLALRGGEFRGVFGLALAEDIALRQFLGIGVGRLIVAARELGVESTCSFPCGSRDKKAVRDGEQYGMPGQQRRTGGTAILRGRAVTLDAEHAGRPEAEREGPDHRAQRNADPAALQRR
jgi:hypothetical protein